MREFYAACRTIKITQSIPVRDRRSATSIQLNKSEAKIVLAFDGSGAVVERGDGPGMLPKKFAKAYASLTETDLASWSRKRSRNRLIMSGYFDGRGALIRGWLTDFGLKVREEVARQHRHEIIQTRRSAWLGSSDDIANRLLAYHRDQALGLSEALDKGPGGGIFGRNKERIENELAFHEAAIQHLQG